MLPSFCSGGINFNPTSSMLPSFCSGGIFLIQHPQCSIFLLWRYLFNPTPSLLPSLCSGGIFLIPHPQCSHLSALEAFFLIPHPHCSHLFWSQPMVLVHTKAKSAQLPSCNYHLPLYLWIGMGMNCLPPFLCRTSNYSAAQNCGWQTMELQLHQCETAVASPVCRRCYKTEALGGS